VQITDGLALDYRAAFSADECREYRVSGRVRCKSHDRLTEARLMPRESALFGYQVALRSNKVTIQGPFAPPLTVRLTSDPPIPTAGIDRVGILASCRVTANGMVCRRRDPAN
jgi:hypothetical protein